MQNARPKAKFTAFPPDAVNHSIPSRFRHIAQQYPGRTAVKSQNQSVSFLQLDRYAASIGVHIHTIDPVKNKPVAVCLPHEAKLIAALMGILYAGKCYLPIDPAYPREWANHVLDQIDSCLMITDTAGIESGLFSGRDNVLILNLDLIEINTLSRPADPVYPGNNAYIIFTSGTAGKPKGVVHSHRNIMRMAKDYTNAVQITPEDRVSLLSSCSFSMSVIDIFSALLNGASLILYDVRKRGVNQIPLWLKKEKITIYHSVTSLFSRMTASLSTEGDFPLIRLVKLGGEPVYQKHFQMFKKHFSSACRFMNGYGSSEILQAAQHILTKENPLEDNIVPIGYPTPDVEILILDKNTNPVNTGETGEIHIRSRYLARHYWGQPQLTMQRFFPDPEDGGKRIYRTGDIGRRDKNGCITHLGRVDNEVKIRGNLVNTLIIENVLLNHPLVEEAVVKVTSDDTNEKHLTALLVSRNGILDENELRRYLAERLPIFYIPSRFQIKDQIPLTNTGKLDRKSAGFIHILTPGWEKIQAPKNSACGVCCGSKNWVVIGDDKNLGRRFRDKLLKDGHNSLNFTAGEAENYDSLLNNLRQGGFIPDHILYIHKNLRRGSPPDFYYADLIQICRALLRRVRGRPLKLHVISGPVNSLRGTEKIEPKTALLLGPAKVLPHENSQFSCTFLDIDHVDESIHGSLFIEQAVSFFDKQNNPPYLAFRGGEFYRQKWFALDKRKKTKKLLS